MVSMNCVKDFLAQKRFAFVGVSSQPKDFSRALFREFRARGYDAIPVHLAADEIEGLPCARSLHEIEPPVDSVLIMTPPEVAEILVRECVRSGIKRVWLYRGAGGGSVTAEAVRLCEENHIAVVPGECPFMFFPETAWIHRFHGFVKQIATAYPR
jgi:predicted CoA-binding protein